MRHALSVVIVATMTALTTAQALAGEVRDIGSLDRQPFLGLTIAGLYGGRVSVDPVPGGPAEAAGVDYGDIVFSLNGEGVTSAEQFYEKLERLEVGGEVSLDLSNSGTRRTVKFDLEPLPWEQAPEGVDLVYDSLDVGEGVVLRTITAMPANATGPVPGVLYLQPMACISVEETVGEQSTRLQFIHDLAEAGYAVMRVERSGTGDSTGPPCGELDFDTEVNHAEAALEKLMGYREVARERTFVFGHDMGGAVAPLIAKDAGLAGVIAYGAPYRSYIEQQVDSGRRQARLQIRFVEQTSLTYEGIEEAMRGLARVYHHLLVDEMSIEELGEAHPDLALFARALFPDGKRSGTRSLAYFRQLNDERLARAWSDVDCPVLVLRGEFDWVASAMDAELIAETVNDVRKGAATLQDQSYTGHFFERYASLEATLDQFSETVYAESIAPAVADWLTRQPARSDDDGDVPATAQDPE